MANGTQQVTLSDMRQASAPIADQSTAVGFGSAGGFELLQRGAKLLAASTLVPKDYQGNMPNCVIALNMANRIGADPLLVMQNLYIVHSRPGWSAKFLIATFNQCGRFSAIRFEWVGSRGDGKEPADDWGCRAWATEKATGERITGALVTIGLAKREGWYAKSGSKWQTIPEQMLMYRSAAWLVNTHAPEISMGLNTADELGDVVDLDRSPDGSFQARAEDLRREMVEVEAEAQAVQSADAPKEESQDLARARALIVDLEALTPGEADRLFVATCGDQASIEELDVEKLRELIVALEGQIRIKKAGKKAKPASGEQAPLY